jgi:RecA-family ATPase
LPVDDFLDLGEEDEAVDWILDEYLPAGGLALLAGKPKEGKTTLTYELVVRVAKGHPFLNRSTSGGGVLMLATEEHPRDVRLRLRALGARGLSNLFIRARQVDPTPETFETIHRLVTKHAIKLVLVDTLGAFWKVRDENDAAEVTQAKKPFLALARATGACVFLIHHARKSDVSYGEEIRGSGALFAAVDIPMILKRHEVQTQRVLHAISRYPDTPDSY